MAWYTRVWKGRPDTMKTSSLTASMALLFLVLGCPGGDPADDDVADDDASGDDDATGDDDVGDDDTTGDDDSGDDDSAQEGPYGPPNQWWHASEDDVPPGLTGTGYEVGDTAHEFLLKDQSGDQVSLYQFYGRTVALSFNFFDCPPCQEAEEGFSTCWQDLSSQGAEVMFITVLFNDAELGDLTTWVNWLGSTHAVLADPNNSLDGYIPGGYVPSWTVIGPDMVILRVDGFSFSCDWFETWL